jgi:formylglycine-generating enzyme required for sulfatase activity
MRKKRRQEAIFSVVAGLGRKPSQPGPIPADISPKSSPGEIQRPPVPEPSAPQSALPKPPEAGVSQSAPPANHVATRPLPPMNVAVPIEESLPPAASKELPHSFSQATVTETPSLPGLAGSETVPEESPGQFFSSIKLGAESLDFDRLLVGNFADRDLAVENEGNSPCVLTAMGGLPEAGFSLPVLPELPFTLGPADMRVFTVRFTPDSVGKKTAKLSIRCDGQKASEYEVRLIGEAVRTFNTPHGLYYSPVFNSLEMSFVYIPPGSCIIGSPEVEPGRSHDERQFSVTLSRGFYLQTTPVTQEQWQAVTGDKPASSSFGGHYPVENVSWFECQAFIQKLNRLGEGAYRLPTEAEWEYACRAGGIASLGDRQLIALFCEPDPLLDAAAWYCGNSDRHSHPVGLKNSNAWDLFDMHGNVMEWCQDWYGEYPTGEATDPAGPPAGVDRVIRGGSWFSSAKNCRAASRAKWAPNSRSNYLGFRLVKKLT